jgi:hypothetical protein
MVVLNPTDVHSVPVIVYERHIDPRAQRKNTVIVCLSLLCICTFAASGSAYVVSVVGDISILALMFLVIMFGSGMLSEVWGEFGVFDIIL